MCAYQMPVIPAAASGSAKSRAYTLINTVADISVNAQSNTPVKVLAKASVNMLANTSVTTLVTVLTVSMLITNLSMP